MQPFFVVKHRDVFQTHAAFESVLIQQLSISIAGVLRPSIRVTNRYNAYISFIGLRHIKLTIQNIVKHRQAMSTLCCHLVLLAVTHLHSRLFHQPPCLVATHIVALLPETLAHSPTAVATSHPVVYFLNCFMQLCALFAELTASLSTMRAVTITTDTQDLAHQANRIGILMLGDKRFFNISFSCSRRLTCFFKSAIWRCSSLMLPLPRKLCSPSFSACFNQRDNTFGLIPRLREA